MNSTGHCFTVIMFTTLYKALVSADEILKCDHSNDSYRAVLFCGPYAVQSGFKCDIQIKALRFSVH